MQLQAWALWTAAHNPIQLIKWSRKSEQVMLSGMAGIKSYLEDRGVHLKDLKT